MTGAVTAVTSPSAVPSHPVPEVASEEAPPNRLLLAALLVLFTCSGASGLIYEVVWLRYLSLVFGVTIYAVSTVLTVFMGGLALGGYVAGRIADQLRRPLRAYGLAEVGIGALALLTPAAFRLLGALYRALYPSLPHDLTSLSLARFALACLVLLPPATLMGATLPLVVRSSLGRSASLGTSISLLYACNTAGGIVGAYLAGFVLIGRAGVQATTLTAAALNLLAGAGAIALDAWLGRRQEPAKVAARQPELPTRPVPPAALRWLLAAFFLSGLASLAYQVIWTRILAIFFEATTYAFNLILCTFLLGLAAGSYAIAPAINRRANWLLVAAVMEWGVAVTALLSITVIGHLYGLTQALRYVPLLDHLVSGEQRATALMAFLTMFPTTLILGAAFPVILRLYASGAAAHDRGTAGQRVGRAYATNVCGSIVGSWASGFVLVPLLGTQVSLVLLAAGNALVAAALLRYAWPRGFRWAAPLGLATAAAAASLTPNMYAAVFARFGDPVLWYQEGLEQTVTILQGPGTRRMFLNGWHQADDSASTVEFHALIGHLPMLVQPLQGGVSARRVLVIGLGGGVTAGAASTYDQAQLDVVELSGSVVEGARYFSHVNEFVVDAPNVSYRTDDGRNFLLLAGRSYDVIMADVVQPQHAGSAALYSLEYYDLARRALTERGLMVQWIDRRLPENQYKLLLRTFLRAFPYVTAWADGTLVTGSAAPLAPDEALVAQRLNGSARSAAARVGLTSAREVMGLRTAGDAALRAYVGDGPIVTDDHPYIEFFRSLPHDDHPADLSGLR